MSIFSNMSVVIPCSHDEPSEWVQELVAVALDEANDVWVVCESESIATTLAISGTERLRVRAQSQPGGGKVSALNDGLQWARSTFVVFIDSDVKLAGGEITTTEELLDSGVDFVGAGYGRKAAFPILSPTSGWFFGARKTTFIAAGGWKGDGLNEDVFTIRGLQKQGYRVVDGGFTVGLRRPVKNPAVKFLSAMFGR
ncbi:MAG TPA: glycosyltransferase family 2 protein [Thermoplasmata archaeon]|nr:glycosyltransferase family 2 protein [Thermoplasmata archaeon]